MTTINMRPESIGVGTKKAQSEEMARILVLGREAPLPKLTISSHGDNWDVDFMPDNKGPSSTGVGRGTMRGAR